MSMKDSKHEKLSTQFIVTQDHGVETEEKAYFIRWSIRKVWTKCWFLVEGMSPGKKFCYIQNIA